MKRKPNIPFLNKLLLLVSLAPLLSCNPGEINASGTKNNPIVYSGYFPDQAFVYKESPAILAGPSQGPSIDIGSFLDKQPELITDNSNLSTDCNLMLSSTLSLSECIRSRSDKVLSEKALAKKADGSWIFNPDSKEFYQVNALYHVQKSAETFFKKLQFAYDQLQTLPVTAPRSIPNYLKDSGLYWFKAIDPTNRGLLFNTNYLTSYSQCNLAQNASFSPAGPELCFGYHSTFPGFFFVQDPSLIYHEFAHGLVSIMMNMRNGTTAISSHPLRSNLGSYGYDEAGAINEGIADYYSFVMNKRTHFGEWALGIGSESSRPMKEDDPSHVPGVDVSSEGRLSYPHYLLYDSNRPESPLEDTHFAGQIISHYLVALTDSIKTNCGLDSDEDIAHDTSTSYVMLLLAETLSELGDLNASGVDDNTLNTPSATLAFNNLDSTSSYIWAQYVNQTTYRRFSQVMAKNIYRYLSAPGGLCTGLTKNISEKLLDDYGLLLFKTYNNNGNSTKDVTLKYEDAGVGIAPQSLISVTETNRKKSVLVSKDLLEVTSRDAASGRVGFYLLDTRSDIEGLLTDLLFKGFPIPLSAVTSVEFNNSNLKISPGEIVGVVPNLFNKSNITMAGVQVLATDWDHVDITSTTTGNFKPCVLDETTTVDQGGELANTCTTAYPDTSYNRLVKQAGGLFLPNAVAPVCMVQVNDATSSKWVSQNEFRKRSGLSLLDKDCLGFSMTTNSNVPDFNYNPHECLVRFLPGVSDAFFSKIEPQKSYFESVVKPSEDKSFNVGNMLLMEVNKWIPPGTKFRCRMRARFSNCSDCYSDPADATNDDYIDSELNGAKPFKVINFDFEVND